MPPRPSKADLGAVADVGVRFCYNSVTIPTSQHCPLLRHMQRLSDFLLGGESHATCLMRSAALVERAARIVSIIERKIFAPSALPRWASEARSGCGIKPKTFRSRLQIPAMFWIEPFGFASGTIWPWLSA